MHFSESIFLTHLRSFEWPMLQIVHPSLHPHHNKESAMFDKRQEIIQIKFLMRQFLELYSSVLEKLSKWRHVWKDVSMLLNCSLLSLLNIKWYKKWLSSDRSAIITKMIKTLDCFVEIILTHSALYTRD